jgi:hypothetical protein
VRADRDEKRLGARALGASVEMHYLDGSIDELYRRLEARTKARTMGEVRITREMLLGYAQFFEPPDGDELDLFDNPSAGQTPPGGAAAVQSPGRGR